MTINACVWSKVNVETNREDVTMKVENLSNKETDRDKAKSILKF